ncbi:MAG: NADPH:quinone oxidoreductase family protein [Myxococcales bacterium]|nr:NADPH:quinone oxidoreductase family protein [Myxococcales bacterium]
MRALHCTATGSLDNLVLREDLPEPRAAAGEVVVDVAACGINFPDVLLVHGKYQFRPDPPFSPGGEISGTVREVGEGVSGLTVGQRVCAWMPYGGLAERVGVSALAAWPIPEGVDMVVAAGSLVTYGTTWHALVDRAGLVAGETLLVLGAAGGVGVAAIQIGKLLGARVIAAASSADKLEFCKRIGADETIDYTREDLKTRVKELTGAGVDVVYDPVGGSFTEAALRATAWNGRVLVVGFAAGDIPKVPTNLCLLKGASLVGVFWGHFATREHEKARRELAEILERVRDGRIVPPIHATYPLERGADAIRELEDRKVRGKVVVRVQP